MSLYNILFGKNSQSELLLAVIGLRECDIERFRDVHIDGDEIRVYTRTGGGNRSAYPNILMRKTKGWLRSEDDDFDSTYATDYFAIPARFKADVAKLGDVLKHGIRAAFARHLSVTLRRDPTENDKSAAAYESERQALAKTQHLIANGHTFVPLDDYAMEEALKLAEANNGNLRAFWGIQPLRVYAKTNFRRWPNAIDKATADSVTRIETAYDWTVDDAYWEHCIARFGEKYLIAMAKIQEGVDSLKEKARQ